MLKDYIEKNSIGTLFENYNLKKLTTFKIGGICHYYIEVSSIFKFAISLKSLREGPPP